MAFEKNEKRRNRWYFGGVSSATAACFTHPLDLIKVHLQTQQEKTSVGAVCSHLYKTEGLLGFYSGISASLARQLTYTTSRFAIYEIGKSYIDPNNFASTVGVAAIAGTIGGFVGVPMDLINVRMQNDMKLPPDKRRNYKHVIDGFMRITREEGAKSLFTGSATAVSRGVLMTIGQNAMYDKVKATLLATGLFEDNSMCHFNSSFITGGIATLMTQPLDVLKTRAMNAKPGEFKGLLDIVLYTAKAGPLGFFKGFLPSFVRIGPHTILLFMIMEQLRLYFGWLPAEKKPG